MAVKDKRCKDSYCGCGVKDRKGQGMVLVMVDDLPGLLPLITFLALLFLAIFRCSCGDLEANLNCSVECSNIIDYRTVPVSSRKVHSNKDGSISQP